MLPNGFPRFSFPPPSKIDARWVLLNGVTRRHARPEFFSAEFFCFACLSHFWYFEQLLLLPLTVKVSVVVSADQSRVTTRTFLKKKKSFFLQLIDHAISKCISWLEKRLNKVTISSKKNRIFCIFLLFVNFFLRLWASIWESPFPGFRRSCFKY